ncbi:hypothetical protein ACT4US_28790 [Bacillus sp. HC-Mk]
MIYFSKSTNGFFFDGINSDMPADIVEISTDLYNELIAGQQEGGKLITSDENGLPVLKSPAINSLYKSVLISTMSAGMSLFIPSKKKPLVDFEK